MTAQQTTKTYMVMDYEWELLPNFEGQCPLEKCRLEHEFNMNSFEKYVNEYIEQGWTPLGPPAFVNGWSNVSSDRFIHQAMTLDMEKHLQYMARTEESNKSSPPPLRRSARLSQNP
jgi:hypothetical protein